ncbi:MAG: DUF192 domain-containing protein [Rhodocyclaceae bacterium]|nr:MAG: DUF192 domain-containing protein [Rhodocyclaceae bacterium]
MTRPSLKPLVVATLLLAAVGARSQGSLELSAGIHRIRAEVVNTSQSRAEGLMYRKNLPANYGMLFVFDQAAQHCMWMRNTLMPLSVAFIDASGRIINIEEMLPQTEMNHCAAKPAKFALEMSAGWFRSRGLSSGTQLNGIDKAPAAR